MKRSNESGNERRPSGGSGRREPVEGRFTRYASRTTGLEQDQWLQLAVRTLARRDRTTAQIATLLAAKGASPAQVRAVVRRLVSSKYLDDAAFAARWVDRRLARMPMGRARLKEELRATGCPEELVQETLRAAYRRVSERDLAMQVIATAGPITSPKAFSRVARLLSQRGFGEDVIETVMRPLLHEE